MFKHLRAFFSFISVIMKKSGFVSIVGKPNAGKSTLLNSILGTKLSIVTRKAQTTRRKVTGIYTDNDVQIVFLDTPGIIEPKYELQKTMMKYVNEAFDESDIILFLIDVSTYESTDDIAGSELSSILKTIQKPKFVVLNKIDKLKDIHELLPIIEKISALKIFDEIVPVSARKNSEINTILNLITKYLPEHEFYFDEDYLSTENQRFFVSEMIREELFKYYSDELPYSADIQISSFKEREEGKWYIAADIIIERSSQKKIIIGERGSKIKELGRRSRIQIENYLQMPVYLELFVKVRDKWRNDKDSLKSFGY